MPRDIPPPPAPPPPVLGPAQANQLGQVAGTIATGVGGGLSTLGGGFADAYAIGSPPADQAATTAAGRVADAEAAKVNRAYNAAGGTGKLIPTDPEGQLRQILTAAGVDTSGNNAGVEAAISASASYFASLDPSAQSAFIAAMASRADYKAPVAPGVADYQTAVSSYGFTAGFNDYTSSQVGLGGIPHTAEAVAHMPGAKVEQQGYIINPDNGAVLFKNGVIFDPGTGNLVFPQGDPNVIGSGSWMHSVTKWAPEKVLEWRKKLGEQGWLPVTDALNGSGDADATFLQAISAYQNARYSNYGTPIAKTSVDLSQYGPSGNKIMDLNQVRGTITAQVRSQYRTTFGQDPSAGELKSWTDFVISRGMAQQQQGLEPGTAESNALASFGELANRSPQAQYLQTQSEENTSLHDALTSAVAATASVTR